MGNSNVLGSGNSSQLLKLSILCTRGARRTCHYTLSSNEDLPGELILQIQLRLPVKSLMRFCCVSKNWLSTISDPKFKKAHFKLASQQQTLSPRLLISSESQIKSLELDAPSFCDKHFVKSLTSPFQRPLNTFPPILLGSCHGLILMLNLKPWPGLLYIWNPTTHCAQSIPLSSQLRIIYNCGIGHVSATDDYKIIMRSHLCSDSKRISVVEIFSLRANSWKSKEVPMFSRTLFCAGVVSNEALHWLDMFSDDESFRQTVLAFDLVKEEFGKIALPNVDNECNMRTRDVCVLSGGCLGLTAFSNSGFIQCWVMTEYNVPMSWTKLFNIYVAIPHCNFMKLVFVSENCVIVKQGREDEYYLVRFDRQEEELEDEVVVCTGNISLSRDT
ncbi:hypothetical protein OROMI_027921 [Orobanche minor]